MSTAAPINRAILIQMHKALWRCYIDDHGKQMFTEKRAKFIVDSLVANQFERIVVVKVDAVVK